MSKVLLTGCIRSVTASVQSVTDWVYQKCHCQSPKCYWLSVSEVSLPESKVLLTECIRSVTASVLVLLTECIRCVTASVQSVTDREYQKCHYQSPKYYWLSVSEVSLPVSKVLLSVSEVSLPESKVLLTECIRGVTASVQSVTECIRSVIASVQSVTDWVYQKCPKGCWWCLTC